MKQNFVRLSTRAKTVSLRTLALVMGLVMLLSAVGVGSTLSAFALTNDGSGDQAASLSAAADLGTGIADTATQLKPTLPAYANASLRGDKEDLVATGAGVDLAGTGNGFAGHNRVYYLNTDNWSSVGVMNNNKNYTAMTQISGTGIYTIWIENSWTENSGGIKFTGDYKDSATFNDYLGHGTTKVYWSTSGSSDTNAINGTSKVITKIDNGSGSYSKSSNSSCVATISSKTVNGGAGHSVSTNTSASTGSSDTATIYPAYGASVSITASDAGDYEFMGFSTTDLSSLPAGASTSTYSYTNVGFNGYDNHDDVYAYFKLKETSYYLTGWLNGGKSGSSSYSKDDNLKFTETATNGVYTYSFTATGDQGGYQYVTITDSSNETYHPAKHGNGTGTAGTSHSSGSYGNDNKWKVGAVAGQTVTFTWDTRGTNPTLSWTVSGGTVSSDWLYSKDGTTKFTPPTTSEGTFRFVWSTNDDGPGKSGTTAIATKVGTNAYWADITSYVKSNSQFYFALANNDNNGGIRGNKQEQINGEAIAPGSTGTISGGGFVAEMKEKSTVTGTAYFQLIRNVDFTKISAIGVLAEYSGSGKVNYKYYYKTVSSGDDQITTVNVYAKDGAAPINWDNKGAGGASATSGTAYNYAAIATTTITQIDGATPESGVVSSVACGDESSKYQVATVDAGKSITVKTTIASDYRSK